MPPFDLGDEEAICRKLLDLPCRYAPPVPLFNEALRQLWFHDARLHTFREDACTEMKVLRAFQDAGWPHCVVHPLGPAATHNSKKYRGWLRTAVQRLNECQSPQLIHFRSRSKPLSVTWEPEIPKGVIAITPPNA